MPAQDEFIRTALRVPPDLHAQLHAAATANDRTFNAEILARLRSTFDAGAVDRRLAALECQVSALTKKAVKR